MSAPIDLDEIRACYERYGKSWPCAEDDRFWAITSALSAANHVPTLLAEVERRTLTDDQRDALRSLLALVHYDDLAKAWYDLLPDWLTGGAA